ncbi:MAG: preprotein translocase subunit YajC [Actinomycetota bacterium]|nr:preprotein translocase subunit YajC [Actinomycetota bacterium]
MLTVGGFYGKIKDVREDSFIITLSSGVDVKVSKSAVSKKVS